MRARGTHRLGRAPTGGRAGTRRRARRDCSDRRSGSGRPGSGRRPPRSRRRSRTLRLLSLATGTVLARRKLQSVRVRVSRRDETRRHTWWGRGRGRLTPVLRCEAAVESELAGRLHSGLEIDGHHAAGASAAHQQGSRQKAAKRTTWTTEDNCKSAKARRGAACLNVARGTVVPAIGW